MEAAQTQTRDGQGWAEDAKPDAAMTLLFVEMGVGYDQHGQDITAAAVRACKDAISSNSIPAFRRGTKRKSLSPVCCLSGILSNNSSSCLLHGMQFIQVFVDCVLVDVDCVCRGHTWGEQRPDETAVQTRRAKADAAPAGR
jgi:hypothetical protein